MCLSFKGHWICLRIYNDSTKINIIMTGSTLCYKLIFFHDDTCSIICLTCKNRSFTNKVPYIQCIVQLKPFWQSLSKIQMYNVMLSIGMLKHVCTDYKNTHQNHKLAVIQTSYPSILWSVYCHCHAFGIWRIAWPNLIKIEYNIVDDKMVDPKFADSQNSKSQMPN